MKIVIIDDLGTVVTNIGRAFGMLGHSCLGIHVKGSRVDDTTEAADLERIQKAIIRYKPDLYFIDQGCHPLGGVIAHELQLPRDRVVGTTTSEVPQQYAFAQLSLKERMNGEFNPGISVHVLSFLFRHREHLERLGLKVLDVPPAELEFMTTCSPNHLRE